MSRLSRRYPEIAGLTWGAEGAARLKALARERATVDKKFRTEYAEQALEEDDRATRRWVKQEPPPGAPTKPQETPVHPQHKAEAFAEGMGCSHATARRGWSASDRS